MAFTLAIVGRTNVGKSTLFNRLVGKRLALVDDAPGVTRDRREGEGRLGDLVFTVVDTAGFEDAPSDSLAGRMRGQTGRAVQEADAALLLVDARAGLLPADLDFVQWLRKSQTPVLLVANKCEGAGGGWASLESFRLGFGEPIPISAEHGEGMGDLYDALAPLVHAKQAGPAPGAVEPEGTAERAPKALKLAIVGRPNVGKSTMINRLVGEDRLLTGPEAGITRDAIGLEWSYRGRAIRLVDTAGLRRRAKVVDRLEWLSGEDARRAIRFAEVVVLVLDAEVMLEKQDLAIARHVEEEGRALLLAVNKWDLISHPRSALEKLRHRLETSLPQCRGLPVIPLSAKTGRGLDRMMEAAFELVETWSRRVGTPLLNRWLQAMEESHPPPLVDGRRLKLRYISQTKTRPPSFTLFCNLPESMPDSYQRYLVNGLRERFTLAGVPIRIQLRRSDNPYVPRSAAGRRRRS